MKNILMIIKGRSVLSRPLGCVGVPVVHYILDMQDVKGICSHDDVRRKRTATINIPHLER